MEIKPVKMACGPIKTRKQNENEKNVLKTAFVPNIDING